MAQTGIRSWTILQPELQVVEAMEAIYRPVQWDAYLGYAKLLQPEREQIDGFIDNVRYRSLARAG